MNAREITVGLSVCCSARPPWLATYRLGLVRELAEELNELLPLGFLHGQDDDRQLVHPHKLLRHGELVFLIFRLCQRLLDVFECPRNGRVCRAVSDKFTALAALSAMMDELLTFPSPFPP